ncbi:MAG: SRPBCC domain-containing protein [Bacteroidia bacterium]|nr:SRPBCC domain-containing protein [Bacteroidia bacterium]
MSTPVSTHQEGRALTERQTFSRTTTIRQLIQAEPAVIWSLLTRAADYPRWNSTVISIEGEISPGSSIKLKSTLAPERTFALKVKTMMAPARLSWGDAMGTRTYSLESAPQGTLFTMTEKIGGPIFPLFASQIPSFDASFEQFTADLKRAAESSTHA